VRLDWTVKRSVLPNGLGVTVVARPGSETTAVYLRVPSAGDRSTGDVAVMAEALRAGTLHGSKGELYINPKLGLMPIGIATEPAGTTFSWHVLPRAGRTAVELLGEFVLKPAFDPAEVNIRLQQELANIQRDSVTLQRHAQQVARAALPTLATPSHEEDARGLFQLDPARLKQIHACTMLPTGAELVVVGPLDPGQALSWATAAFGGWRAQAPAAGCEQWRQPALAGAAAGSTASSPRLSRAELRMIFGAIGDPMLFIEVPGPAIDSPDYVPFMLLSYLLENRRSGAAWEVRHAGGTYGIRSGIFDGYPHLTLLEVQGQVEPDAVQQALRSLIADIRGLAASLREEELEAVKRRSRNGLLNWLSSNEAVAILALNHARRGLGIDHLLESPNELSRIDLARCREVAERWLTQAEPSIVVTGPVKSGLGIAVTMKTMAWTDKPQAHRKLK
jgi:predicted Zn-dependent peptidase